MTTLEDQLRQTLHDMADDVESVNLLSRLDRTEDRAPRAVLRRGIAVATVAAAIVAAVATGSFLVLRSDQPSVIEPVVRPPKDLHLSQASTSAPGRSSLLVVLSDNTARDFIHLKPAYVLPGDADTAVLVAESETIPTWTQHLSADGTRLVRQSDTDRGSTLEILDLTSGSGDDVGGHMGDCPALSPDNGTLALYDPGYDLVLIDVGSGVQRVVRRLPEPTVDVDCGGLAWTPDSRFLVYRADTGSTVIDRKEEVSRDLGDVVAVNGSMAWSPDGRSILLYQRRAARFIVRDMEDGTDTVLGRPDGAVRPLGWAGSRVAWLAGEPGDQDLITTDAEGSNALPWMRLDVGSLPVERVSWSRALSGTAATP